MSKTNINKINKLVGKNFPEIRSKWNDSEFQALLYKALRPSKNKKEGDENLPKKHSSYIKFCMDERKNMRELYPDLSATEITKKLGEEWGRLKETDIDNIIEKYGYVEKK